MMTTTSMLRCFLFVLAFSLSTSGAVFAGPGAHGPNGEHLDTSGAASNALNALPRFETATELFELVAVLGGGELSMLIDRFDSNAPVLGARVEVEAEGRTVEAKFHADHGDYAIDDPGFVAALSKPGEHALVISVVAGEHGDLLNGTLVVAAADTPVPVTSYGHDDHAHDHEVERWMWIGAGIAGLGAVMLIVWLRRNRRSDASAVGGAR